MSLPCRTFLVDDNFYRLLLYFDPNLFILEHVLQLNLQNFCPCVVLFI